MTAPEFPFRRGLKDAVWLEGDKAILRGQNWEWMFIWGGFLRTKVEWRWEPLPNFLCSKPSHILAALNQLQVALPCRSPQLSPSLPSAPFRLCFLSCLLYVTRCPFGSTPAPLPFLSSLTVFQNLYFSLLQSHNDQPESRNAPRTAINPEL